MLAVIGIFDVLNAAKSSATDPSWLGSYNEAYLVVAFIYFVFRLRGVAIQPLARTPARWLRGPDWRQKVTYPGSRHLADWIVPSFAGSTACARQVDSPTLFNPRDLENAGSVCNIKFIGIGGVV